MRVNWMGMGSLDGRSEVHVETPEHPHRWIELEAAERLGLPAGRVVAVPIDGGRRLVQGRLLLRVGDALGPVLGRYMGEV